jgi:hypothetical protein
MGNGVIENMTDVVVNGIGVVAFGGVIVNGFGLTPSGGAKMNGFRGVPPST